MARMKRALVGAVIVASFFSCAPGNNLFQNKSPLNELFNRNNISNQQTSGSICRMERGYLIYGTGEREKKIRFELMRDERLLGFSQTGERVAILTSHALYLYPGTERMKYLQPGDVGYTRIGFIELEGGALSEKGDVFILWAGNGVEAYKLSDFGMEAVLSYDIDVPIIRVEIDSRKEQIIIQTRNEGYYFDFDGNELKK